MASEIAVLTEVIRGLEAKVDEQQKLLQKLLAREGEVTSEEKRGPGRPSKKNKRDHGPYPKGEIPEHLKQWHELVTATLEDMRSKGWTHPESGKEATRRDAITEASRRKKEGVETAPAEPATEKPKRVVKVKKPAVETAAEPAAEPVVIAAPVQAGDPAQAGEPVGALAVPEEAAPPTKKRGGKKAQA